MFFKFSDKPTCGRLLGPVQVCFLIVLYVANCFYRVLGVGLFSGFYISLTPDPGDGTCLYACINDGLQFESSDARFGGGFLLDFLSSLFRLVEATLFSPRTCRTALLAVCFRCLVKLQHVSGLFV